MKRLKEGRIFLGTLRRRKDNWIGGKRILPTVLEDIVNKRRKRERQIQDHI